MVEVVSIVGKSDSGKTTLLEKLIAHLNDQGYRIGTLKHDAHNFEMDHKGKDTYRHFHAGANRTMIAAAHKLALIQNLDRPLTIDEMLARYFDDVDIVLTEGYKSADKPKIEVYRPEIHKKPLCTLEDGLIAFVSSVEPTEDVPHFTPDETEKIADFLITNYMNKNS